MLWSETNELSTLIKQVDQGGYSHTLLYVGIDPDDGEHKVIHATSKGIIKQDLSDIITNQAVDLLDVYRCRGDFAVDKVLANAESYLGGSYFYSELLLGGLVIMVVDEMHDPAKQIKTRISLAKKMHAIAQQLKKPGGPEPMVCVQVATSAYWDADTSDQRTYAIKVKLDGGRKRVPQLFKKLLKTLIDFIKLTIGSHHESNELTVSPDVEPVILKAGSTDLPLGTCTLRDLSHSPSLELVGSLKDEQN